MENSFRVIWRLFLAGMALVVAIAWWSDRNKKAAEALEAEAARREEARLLQAAETAARLAKEAPPPVDDWVRYAAQFKAVSDCGVARRFEDGLAAAEMLLAEVEKDARVAQKVTGYAYALCSWMCEGLARWDRVVSDGEKAAQLWLGNEHEMWDSWIMLQDRLSTAYLKLGRKGESLLAAERVLAFIPGHPQNYPGIENVLRARQRDLLAEAGRTEEILKAAREWSRRLAGQFLDEPEIRAQWIIGVGRAFAAAGAQEEALARYRVAKAVALTESKPSASARADAELWEADALLALGQAEEGLAIIARLAAELTAADAVELRVERLGQLVATLSGRERDAEALVLARQQQRLLQEHGLETPARRYDCLREQALRLGDLGQYDESHALFREVAELSRKRSGSDSSDHIHDMVAVAGGVFRQGRTTEAVALLRECVVKAERLQPGKEALLENALETLGWVLANSGLDAAGAEPVLRRAIALNEKRLGPGHHSSLLSRTNLLAALVCLERWTDAERCHDEL